MENKTNDQLAFDGANSQVTDKFPCTNCGANLTYKPGTTSLKCEFCQTENEIPKIEGNVEEQDFTAFLEQESGSAPKLTVSVVNCHNCGASTSVEPHLQTADCPYCASPLVLAEKKEENLIRPGGILPFKIKREETLKIFQNWLKKLWFAPSKLKHAVNTVDAFKAMYVPYWTFDSFCDCNYSGMRGTYYYVQEPYTTTENGRTVTRTRQVRKTRWTPCSGKVTNDFDDVLVLASKNLPQKDIDSLEPWDLKQNEPFNDAYLSGIITEKYQVTLKDGFNLGKVKMDNVMSGIVRRDIGGDEQRILSMHPRYSKITFKLLLLPLYISAYKFKGKLYNVYVNGRTGKMKGQRPIAWGKVALLVIGIIAVIVTLYLIFGNQK
jgi:LSD1 subclass zinc finger protein